MNITVTIQAPELVKAINALAQSFSGMQNIGVQAPNISVEKGASDSNEEPVKETKAETKTETKAEAPKEDKPTISLETVRAKLAALSQQGKQAQVKELLTQFGAKKLTAVPEEKYGELLAAAEKL